MKKYLTMAIFAAAAISAYAEVSVADITARQRWPWNNLVDVDFTLSETAGEVYRVSLFAKSTVTGKTLPASTYVSEPMAKAGSNRVTWDFGADYPGFKSNDMKFGVSVACYTESSTPLYMVIDLSGGPDAAKYPVRYTMNAPEHIQGATGEKCQTTELWLRRVRRPSGSVVFGNSYKDDWNGSFYGTMSRDYWLGVFEVTQKQFELVMGNNPSYFTNPAGNGSRPVDGIVVQDDLIATARNPRHYPEENMASDRFFGKINIKAGLKLTLPSSIEWEWAASAGRTSIYDNWYSSDVASIMRYSGNSNKDNVAADSGLDTGTAAVGSYAPNAWGFYDLHGNVAEWMCESRNGWTNQGIAEYLAAYRTEKGDDSLGQSQENPIVDYDGENLDGVFFRQRGGSYADDASASWDKTSLWRWNDLGESGSWARLNKVGFRVAMPVGD